MSDLRLKVRNKIYTSGNHIVDIKNNSNSLIVFLGRQTGESLESYIASFMKDTLKSQIRDTKISWVHIDESNISQLPQKLAEAVRRVEFSPLTNNELFISFVTIMDDELFKTAHKIDINAIEELKTTALGGYSVEIFYDFYGIFASGAKYEYRLNARKTIVDFLDVANGGVHVRKRIYHQACAGDDYYRTAKSIAFMILTNHIGKLSSHVVTDSVVSGEDYTWTTFSLFQKNLAALVIYEMINKLLENQVSGFETTTSETLYQKIREFMAGVEAEMKQIVPAGDANYIPLKVSQRQRELTFAEKVKNKFLPDDQKISPVYYRAEDETESERALLEEQSATLDKYIKGKITAEYIDSVIISLINLCTVMSSINNNQNEAMILSSLIACQNESPSQDTGSSGQFGMYLKKYNEMIADSKSKVISTITDYFRNNVDGYVEKIQKNWNELNLEVNSMINDFAAFHNYFEGIGDLISDKTIPLFSDYDKILDSIDVQRVIKAINQNTEIYSNILSSYYDNVQTAGEIAKKFGNRPIAPELDNINYTLFSSVNVGCPGKLKLVCDDYWFRDHEIAILFTAKNNMSDCNNLPYKA